MTDNKLRFLEYAPLIDVSLWYELERRKLHEWRLETPTVTLCGVIPTPSSVALTKASHGASTVTVSNDFGDKPGDVAGRHTVPITLVNHNTDEDLKAIDRKAALREPLKDLVSSLRAGVFPAAGAVYGVLRTFADLKTHVFTYAIGFPVLDLPHKSSVLIDSKSAGPHDDATHAALLEHIATFGGAATPFLVSNDCKSFTAFTRAALEAHTGDVVVAMADHTPDGAEHPSWAFRNVLAALRLWAPQLSRFSLVCIRATAAGSARFDCSCNPAESAAAAAELQAAADGTAELRVVGWSDSKLKKVDMGALMDPSRLAESSAKLNLGLMKWRMMPDIDLDRISGMKALLLGSGTLGCNIARHLLMWGVNHITLVDRGNVSYSNPVRQTLFELSDVLAEGELRVKSIAAARAIKRILPTCNATGIQMTIRMPGHAVDPGHEEEAHRDIAQLEKLIQEHDVVFLLTDSRESRWLPTLLCTANNKPVINSALGFDSYVVMRHGLPSQPPAERVGCYFCNDVVAPIDSLTARTLDQQCTVTRPGVSAMASALSVELLAAVCNHPRGFECPAYIASEDEASTAKTVIGVVPHQVRGSVSDYNTMVLYGHAYSKCTACSDVIVEKYKTEGAGFIIKCLGQPKLMEEVTGLAAEREAMAQKFSNWDDDTMSGDEDGW